MTRGHACCSPYLRLNQSLRWPFDMELQFGGFGRGFGAATVASLPSPVMSASSSEFWVPAIALSYLGTAMIVSSLLII